jgi:hypothetical protein
MTFPRWVGGMLVLPVVSVVGFVIWDSQDSSARPSALPKDSALIPSRERFASAPVSDPRAELVRTVRPTAMLALPKQQAVASAQSPPSWDTEVEATWRSEREGGAIAPLREENVVQFFERGEACRHRRRRGPLSTGSPVSRSPPADRKMEPGAASDAHGRVRPDARGVPECGVLSGEGGGVSHGRVVRNPFSRTKCSARSVSLSAMT